MGRGGDVCPTNPEIPTDSTNIANLTDPTKPSNANNPNNSLDIGGMALSLNEIENGILRGNKQGAAPLSR